MESPRVAVVVLARAGSSRLPGKLQSDLGGSTVLARCLQRCLQLERADEVILATTTAPADEALAREAAALGIPVVRGSEDDVVARMQQAVAALDQPCDIVVRACADNPLFMPALVDAAVDELWQTGCQLVTPFEHATLPFGFGLVVMTRECLAVIDREATAASYREHVENYCFEHPERFHVRFQLAPEDLTWPELCWTLDYAVDLERLRRLDPVLAGVAVRDQPRVLVEHLRAMRVWVEGRDTGDPAGHDLVLLAADRADLPAPAGVLVVQRFDAAGGSRYGLRYAEPRPAGFPAGAVYLDPNPGCEGTPLEFLGRVADLAPAFLVAAPARPLDLMESVAPPLEKCVRADRRRGFRAPGEEAFPACVVLERAASAAGSGDLLAGLLAELTEHADTDLFLDRATPGELAEAIARLGAERVHEGTPAADPFRVLTVHGAGELEVAGARGPLHASSLGSFWRSGEVRAARARALNAEATR